MTDINVPVMQTEITEPDGLAHRTGAYFANSSPTRALCGKLFHPTKWNEETDGIPLCEACSIMHAYLDNVGVIGPYITYIQTTPIWNGIPYNTATHVLNIKDVKPE